MSKKRKGLSLDEKRDKLLEVYYEKKEVLNLKEIEKWGAKKGVVLQTIKDVNQSLIDDNLVETDKIGIGAFFWAFPSKGFQVRKNLVVDYDRKIQACQAETQQVQAEIDKAQSDRDGKGGNREKTQSELEEATKLRDQLQLELKQFERSDPKILDKISKDTKIAKEAINRWTDNLYVIMQWIQQSRPEASASDLEKQFPIFNNLDYIE